MGHVIWCEPVLSLFKKIFYPNEFLVLTTYFGYPWWRWWEIKSCLPANCLCKFYSTILHYKFYTEIISSPVWPTWMSLLKWEIFILSLSLSSGLSLFMSCFFLVTFRYPWKRRWEGQEIIGFIIQSIYFLLEKFNIHATTQLNILSFQ